VQFDIAEPLIEQRPLGLGFLHAILAEQAMPRFEHWQDALRTVPLGDRDKMRLRSRRNRRCPRGGDASENVGEVLRRISG
jgi:hypothetical protein